LFKILQIYPPLTPSDLIATTSNSPMAIVILAAGRRQGAVEFGSEFGAETIDALSLERVRYGAYVARMTGLPVLVSGGLGSPNDDPLANLMADTLSTDYGIAATWLETQSRNTAENAIYSAEILKSAGVNRVLLVTHAWHMKRAKAAFAANGIAVTPAATAYYVGRPGGLLFSITPSITTLHMSAYALHEIGGSAWYRVRYGY
jgi:uncharacterized SAM-binding protein YcdF (DUF218 family)